MLDVLNMEMLNTYVHQNVQEIFWTRDRAIHRSQPMSISTGRFRSEIAGTWKQYSGRNAQEVDRNQPEKIRKIFGWNTASSSRDFRCFPAGSGGFPASFLQDLVGSSGRNLRLGHKSLYFFMYNMKVYNPHIRSYKPLCLSKYSCYN